MRSTIEHSFGFRRSKQCARLMVRPLEDRVVPTTFTVSNTLDAGNPPAGSLRAAVAAANANPGADTINLAGVSGTITLTAGELAISDAVTITGPGASKLTLSGNNASRVFNTQSAPAAATISVSGLTFISCKSSSAGAAFFANNQAITLSACTFTGNAAINLPGGGGAVAVQGTGTLTATDCTFSNNTSLAAGGAINAAKTVLRRCTVSGNTSSFGTAGGVYAANYLLVEYSTLSGNSAHASGGAVFSNTAANVIVRDSTIAGNTASGGGGLELSNFGALFAIQIQNCTITSNAGGSNGGGIDLSGSGSISISSSILFGDSATNGPEIFRSGAVTMNTSLVQSKSGVTTFSGDAFTNANIGVDPLLSALANYGGTTQTCAIKAGSPAIDNGSNSAGLADDQRGVGFIRTFGSQPDIGAYEGQPQTFVVLNANDNGAGSLRQAITTANAGAGADSITFDPTFFNVGRTISLTTGEIAIADAVTITGPGSSLLTISGANIGRVFNSQSAAAGASINITGMTLTNGHPNGNGGAILADDEALTLTNCVVTSNSATFDGAVGILLGGTFNATDCSFTNNHATERNGGIGVAGSSTVLRRCTVSNNTAMSFGGIYATHNVLLDGCTISGNIANGNSFEGYGGGLGLGNNLAGDVVTIRNSTISGNSAHNEGGGIELYYQVSTLVVQNTTITGNTTTFYGGGIRSNSSAQITIDSSIVFGNFSTYGPDTYGPDISAVATVSSSLIGSKSGASITGDTFTIFHIGVDPLLNPLANNGGTTLTRSLKAGSPAIDNGSNPASLTTDQRGAGFPRVGGPAPDIGAFETQPTTFVVTNANDNGAGSLRQAIINSNSNPGADSITFDPSLFNMPRTITLTTGQIAILDSATITGPGAALATVNGNNSQSLFTNTAGTKVAPAGTAISFSGLTFTSAAGGAITAANNPITLTFANCVFTGNKSSSFGGAIGINNGSLTATDCTFSGNSATFGGGAISDSGTSAKVTLRQCTLSGNTAGSHGGGVAAATYLLIEYSTLSGNMAGSGGAVSSSHVGAAGTLTIRDSTISGNSASDTGGGIDLVDFNGTLRVQNSTITGNTANNKGGAIGLVYGSGVVAIDSSILSADSAPAGPELSIGSVTVNASMIGSASGVTTFTGDAFTNSHIGVDPLLGPLANNGGSTQTRALLAGSPAIDKGTNPVGLSFDQRGTGFPRFIGIQPDIGAFERPLLIVTNANDSGDGSLRQAILNANLLPGADIVNFDPTFFATQRTIVLTSGEIAISDAVTINGPGSSLATINGNTASRMFNTQSAPSGAAINISGLLFLGGKADNGAVIFGGDQSITLNSCALTANAASSTGGAVTLVGATFTATDSIFSFNTSDSNGAINIVGATAKTILRRCTVSGNTSTNGHGGGAYLQHYALIEACTFFNNKANNGRGGALAGSMDSGESITIRNSTISGNSANKAGGGICLNGANGFLRLQNSTITGNTAAVDGGAIALYNGGTAAAVIDSSILFGDSSPFGPEIAGFNTVTANNCLVASTQGTFTFTGDTFTNAHIGVNPLLGSLVNNGGPTLTHALLLGSPAVNQGSNLFGLLTDQRGAGLPRTVGGQTDIGAFEVQSPPAKVSSTMINDGSAQRSRVTSLTVTFSAAVSLPANPADAFQLIRQSDSAAVSLKAVQVINVVTLTFAAGNAVEFNSLADGRYTLTVMAAKVNAGYFDGNGDGNGGDNYVLASDPTPNPPTNIFRYFGDSNGDGAVAANDFVLFRQSFNSVNDIFDFDGDGFVSASDFVNFRQRFNGSI
jgi:fibronectin-binding autotransporter adhesin